MWLLERGMERSNTRRTAITQDIRPWSQGFGRDFEAYLPYYLRPLAAIGAVAFVQDSRQILLVGSKLGPCIPMPFFLFDSGEEKKKELHSIIACGRQSE